MRKDMLAAGAAKATFAGGVGDTDYSRNIYKGNEINPTTVTVEPKVIARKRFRPLGEVLLVRQTVQEELSSIIITEKIEKDKPAEGTVLAIGAEVKTVNVGEQISFGKYAGTEYKLNGEVLLLMELKDVMGIIENAPAEPRVRKSKKH